MSKKKSTKSDKFTKEQLLISSKFKHNRDLISVLLENDKKYSIDDVEKLIEKYMKGSVK